MTDEVEHVTDFASIAAYGVMSTPALVVDGKVVSCGKALNKDDAHDLIARAREWNEPPAEGGLRLRAQLLPEQIAEALGKLLAAGRLRELLRRDGDGAAHKSGRGTAHA